MYDKIAREFEDSREEAQARNKAQEMKSSTCLVNLSIGNLQAGRACCHRVSRRRPTKLFGMPADTGDAFFA
jgi:hypothetical protein